MSFIKLFSFVGMAFIFATLFGSIATNAQAANGYFLIQIQPTDAYIFCLQSDTGELINFELDQDMVLPVDNYNIKVYDSVSIEEGVDATCEELIINNAPTISNQQFEIFPDRKLWLVFSPESNTFLTALNLFDHIGESSCTPTDAQITMENSINCAFNLVNGFNFAIDPLNRPYLMATTNDSSSNTVGSCEIDTTGTKLNCNIPICNSNSCLAAAKHDVYIGFSGDASGTLQPANFTFSLNPRAENSIPVTTTGVTTTPSTSKANTAPTPKTNPTTIRTGGQDAAASKTNKISGNSFLWVGLATLVSLVSARFTNMNFKNWN